MEIYNIWKKDEHWKVIKEGSERALRNFQEKSEAVSFGRDYAQRHGGQLRIWAEEGDTLEDEFTYTLEDAESVSHESGTAEKVEVEPESITTSTRGPFDGIIKGAADATEAVEKLFPVMGKYLSNGIYGTSYYAAYGVVFAAVAISRSIPMPGPLARGLHDGTEAAIEAYEKDHSEMRKDTVAT